MKHFFLLLAACGLLTTAAHAQTCLPPASTTGANPNPVVITSATGNVNQNETVTFTYYQRDTVTYTLQELFTLAEDLIEPLINDPALFNDLYTTLAADPTFGGILPVLGISSGADLQGIVFDLLEALQLGPLTANNPGLGTQSGSTFNVDLAGFLSVTGAELNQIIQIEIITDSLIFNDTSSVLTIDGTISPDTAILADASGAFNANFPATQNFAAFASDTATTAPITGCFDVNLQSTAGYGDFGLSLKPNLRTFIKFLQWPNALTPANNPDLGPVASGGANISVPPLNVAYRPEDLLTAIIVPSSVISSDGVNIPNPIPIFPPLNISVELEVFSSPFDALVTIDAGSLTGLICGIVPGGCPISLSGLGLSIDPADLINSLIVTGDSTLLTTVQIVNAPPNAPSASSTNVNCFGAADGTITLTDNGGGTPPYEYSINGGTSFQTSGNFTNLAPATYNTVIRDAGGSTANGPVVVITQPTSAVNAVIPGANITDADCNGASTGAINLNVTGGTPGYTYLWAPGGATTQDISGLAAGNYLVTVTDANGCIDTVSGNVDEPSAVNVALAGVTNVDCFGASTGAVNITPSGGTVTGNYTYAWTGPGGPYTTQDLNNVAAGTYSVTVTDDNSCTGTQTATVDEPAAALNATVASSTNVSCNGGSDGAINVTVTGGTTNYTYAWTGPSFAATTQDISGVEAGTYNLTVTDANGCTDNIPATTLTEPMVISITSANITDALCGTSTGALDVNVMGGTGTYTYAWSGPSGFSATTEDITGLASGSYTLTVTDGNSCTNSASFTVGDVGGPSVSGTPTNLDCNGDNSGAVNISLTGGTAPFNYAWSGPSGFVATTQDISGLAAGTYNVTVTDDNGCVGSGTTSYTLTQPAVVSGTVSITDVSCNGGSDGAVDLTPTGGSGVFPAAPGTFVWSNPPFFTATTEDIAGLAAGTYTVDIEDDNGCTGTVSATVTEPATAVGVSVASFTNLTTCGVTNGTIDINVSGGTPGYTYAWTGPGSFSATTQDISGLAAGTYNVTATDANGCTATASQAITEPAAATVTLNTATDATCFGASDGALDVDVTGGVAPYTYSWSGPGGFSGSTQDISGLAAGTYDIDVTDDIGCTTPGSFTVNQPTEVDAGITTITNTTCFGDVDGAVDITPTGGTVAGTYTFSWTGPSGPFTTEDISGLAAGDYIVTVTDDNGCLDTDTATVASPAALDTTGVVVTNANCNVADGAIDVTVVGGTAPYTYAWDSAGTLIASEDLASIVSGTYVLTVTDDNLCSASFTISVADLNAPAVVLAATDLTCNGDASGAVDATVTGGVTPYTFAWNGPSGFSATTEDVADLAAGAYSLQVTDDAGCNAALATVTVIEPDAIGLVLASDSATGSVSVLASGGTPPYTYLWNDSSASTTDTVSGLVAGTYTVVVTDANGCETTDSVSLNGATARGEDFSNFEFIKLYPNPTQGLLNIAYELANAGDLNIELFDLTGKRIMEHRVPNAFSGVAQLELKGLTAGTYQLRIQAGGSLQTQRVLLTR